MVNYRIVSVLHERERQHKLKTLDTTRRLLKLNVKLYTSETITTVKIYNEM